MNVQIYILWNRVHVLWPAHVHSYWISSLTGIFSDLCPCLIVKLTHFPFVAEGEFSLTAVTATLAPLIIAEGTDDHIGPEGSGSSWWAWVLK